MIFARGSFFVWLVDAFHYNCNPLIALNIIYLVNLNEDGIFACPIVSFLD
jgi:hypothetical protein